jgi:small GTP-binding protein
MSAAVNYKVVIVGE